MSLPTLDFYAGGAGDLLIDDSRYPPVIEDFLRAERALLDSLAGEFDFLVEVGCMHGRHLDWAATRGKRYLGLDVVPRYVETGRKEAERRGLSPVDYRFILGPAERAHEFLRRQRVPPQRALLFFPFNSIGNMEEAGPVIAAISVSGARFLVSSYRVTARASQGRLEYYERCGYRDIEEVRDSKAVWFLSPDGLRTAAWRPRYVRELCARKGIPVRFNPFSEIGLAYLG